MSVDNFVEVYVYIHLLTELSSLHLEDLVNIFS